MSIKSQGAIEFLIISGIVIFMFTVFFVAIQANTEERNKENEAIIIKNLALSVQDEIFLALKSSDGYIREFQIPQLISGKDYEISIIDNFVHVKTSQNAVSLKLDDFTGNIKKGINIIKKQNGKVYLNSEP